MKRKQRKQGVDVSPGVAGMERGRRKRKRRRKRQGEVGRAAEGSAPESGAAESAPTDKRQASDWTKDFPAPVNRFFRASGIKEPTPVQRKCWPPLRAGKSILTVAPTGSGKTLAYVIPAVLKVLEAGKRASPQVLVLVPTRELALQVLRTCSQISRVVKSFEPLAIYGGVDKQTQVDKLVSKEFLVDVVIGTPGRTRDLVEHGQLELNGVKYVVYDEFDKICSLGFLDDLKHLNAKLKNSGEKKQVVFCSATSRKAAEGLLRSEGIVEDDMDLSRIIVEPEQASLNETISGKVSQKVTQVVHVCAEHKKPRKLMKFLRKVKDEDKAEKRRQASKVLIFCNRIKTTVFLHGFLQKEGIRCCCLNGNMKQQEREKALKNFRAGKAQVMVATDVAARGLHLQGLPYVVNYTFPATLESYIHRVGRTGRCSDSGHAYSFFTQNFKPLAKPLVALLEECGQAVDPNLRRLVESP